MIVAVNLWYAVPRPRLEYLKWPKIRKGPCTKPTIILWIVSKLVQYWALFYAQKGLWGSHDLAMPSMRWAEEEEGAGRLCVSRQFQRADTLGPWLIPQRYGDGSTKYQNLLTKNWLLYQSMPCFLGMNIHLPAIFMFTRVPGCTMVFDTAISGSHTCVVKVGFSSTVKETSQQSMSFVAVHWWHIGGISWTGSVHPLMGPGKSSRGVQSRDGSPFLSKRRGRNWSLLVDHRIHLLVPNQFLLYVYIYMDRYYIYKWIKVTRCKSHIWFLHVRRPSSSLASQPVQITTPFIPELVWGRFQPWIFSKKPINFSWLYQLCPQPNISYILFYSPTSLKGSPTIPEKSKCPQQSTFIDLLQRGGWYSTRALVNIL